MWRISLFHPNKQLAYEVIYNSDEDDGIIHSYDENGYELSEDSWATRYGDLYESIFDSEMSELEIIQDAGDKN